MARKKPQKPPKKVTIPKSRPAKGKGKGKGGLKPKPGGNEDDPDID